MIAPDLPLEPAPRYAFSSSTTRPARRLARWKAMLQPITPPPTTRTSLVVAIVAPFDCPLDYEILSSYSPSARVRRGTGPGLKRVRRKSWSGPVVARGAGPRTIRPEPAAPPPPTPA